MSTIEKAINALKQTAVTEGKERKQKLEKQHTFAQISGITSPNMASPSIDDPDLESAATARITTASDGAPDHHSGESPADALMESEPNSAKAHNPIVTIPFDALHALGFLSPASPRSTTAEEFRAIKRPLLKNIASQSPARIANANLIMVTSALEGDGKTFSSLNLAMSIAMEQDKTVLYVDADVLKATAGKLLGIPQDTPGLIDLLTDDSLQLQDVILPTNMKNFRVLPAGSAHEHATELLAGLSMQQLMLELSVRYADRVIVFDSPPLLLTSESGVLASFMGQIVFVAAANVTPQHAVREALEHIGENKMVAVMLNMAPRRRFNLFGYGHSYGYGYGYGYGSRERLTPGAAEVRNQ